MTEENLVSYPSSLSISAESFENDTLKEFCGII